MSKTDDSSDEDGGDPRSEEFAQVEAALVEWGDAIRAGAKFSVISLPHDDPTTTPSDSLLFTPHGTEVIEAFDALISDSEARESFTQGLTEELKRQGRDKISYVERRLILMAMRYLAVKDYLVEEHGIEIPGDEYSKWKIKLLDQSDEYMEASTYEFASTRKYSLLGPSTKGDESPGLPDLPILAAIAVLETISTLEISLI